MAVGRAVLNEVAMRYEPVVTTSDEKRAVDGYWLSAEEVARWQQKYQTPKKADDDAKSSVSR